MGSFLFFIQAPDNIGAPFNVGNAFDVGKNSLHGIRPPFPSSPFRYTFHPMFTSACSRAIRRLPALAVFAFAAAFFGPNAFAQARHFTILPQWEPQAQFAGIYMAKEKGFYANYGLDVEILRGGPKSPSQTNLVKGKADFATMFLATALKLADEGAPVVNLAQIVKRSSLLLIAKKSRGVLLPKDLDGKRISSWGPEFSIQINDFLRKNRVAVTTLPQGYSVNLFLRDGVDAVSAMLYNEYHAILNTGLDEKDLTVFSMAEFGLNFPEDGLYCLRKTYAADPKACCDMARATLEGWRYAFAHPEETLDVIMREIDAIKLPTNRAHQRWMLARMRDLIAPDGAPGAGALTRPEFTSVAETLQKAGMIDSIPSYEDFHADCDPAL